MSTSFQTDGEGLWAEQQFGAALDYTLDWSESLDIGDTIAESAWSADPGIVVDRAASSDATTSAWVSGGLGGRSYRVTNTITTNTGRVDRRDFRVFVRDGGTLGAGITSVFADLPGAVAAMRRDRLMGPARLWMAGVALTDEYLLGKLLAAERYAERRLRTFLTPVELLPSGASQQERDAFDVAGVRWEEEPGYDHAPEMFTTSNWGMLQLRHTPVIAVHRVVLAYPSPSSPTIEVPKEWLRLDRKYGVLQFVPVQSGAYLGMNAILLSAMSAGLSTPLAVQIRYRAGLTDVSRKHPDLLSLIQRIAVLDVLDEQFLPASGSTSIDGMSQSLSWDSSAYREAIDHKLEALRDSLSGIRLMVV